MKALREPWTELPKNADLDAYNKCSTFRVGIRYNPGWYSAGLVS